MLNQDYITKLLNLEDVIITEVKNIPFGRTTLLHLRKRRYRCRCGKRFFGNNSFLPRYYRVTTRLVAEIIFAIKKVVSATEITSRFNVSFVTAMRYFKCII